LVGHGQVRNVSPICLMGHADIQTTMKYLHYAPREEDARLVAEAFALEQGAPAPS
jgi:hypothetical protein